MWLRILICQEPVDPEFWDRICLEMKLTVYEIPFYHLRILQPECSNNAALNCGRYLYWQLKLLSRFSAGVTTQKVAYLRS